GLCPASSGHRTHAHTCPYTDTHTQTHAHTHTAERNRLDDLYIQTHTNPHRHTREKKMGDDLYIQTPTKPPTHTHTHTHTPTHRREGSLQLGRKRAVASAPPKGTSKCPWSAIWTCHFLCASV